MELQPGVTGSGVAIGTVVTGGTQGSVLFIGAASTLAQDNANFFYDSTNKRLGLRTSTPNYTFEAINPTGGIVERLIGVTNANAPTNSSSIKTLGLGVGNGTSYSLGYSTIWGQKGDGTLIRWMDLTAFATNFILPLFLNNNQSVQSATTLGQTIPMAAVTNANHVAIGARYPAAIPTDFYVGNNTVSFTWLETTGNTTLMTLGGTGNLSTTGYVKPKVLTVATLPAAGTAGVGARLFVTDANAPVWGAAVVGGGAVPVPVYSDGTNWNVG